ncbi:MAG: hypothetical protein K2Z81_19760, partial [Cyanobacteria bacterium]|nr:hypothetical protein [Cyanobacteriota bacterium]
RMTEYIQELQQSGSAILSGVLPGFDLINEFANFQGRLPQLNQARADSQQSQDRTRANESSSSSYSDTRPRNYYSSAEVRALRDRLGLPAVEIEQDARLVQINENGSLTVIPIDDDNTDNARDRERYPLPELEGQRPLRPEDRDKNNFDFRIGLTNYAMRSSENGTLTFFQGNNRLESRDGGSTLVDPVTGADSGYRNIRVENNRLVMTTPGGVRIEREHNGATTRSIVTTTGDNVSIRESDGITTVSDRTGTWRSTDGVTFRNSRGQTWEGDLGIDNSGNYWTQPIGQGRRIQARASTTPRPVEAPVRQPTAPVEAPVAPPPRPILTPGALLPSPAPVEAPVAQPPQPISTPGRLTRRI